MNFHPETNMSFRANNSLSSPDVIRTPTTFPPKARLPLNIEQELQSPRLDNSTIHPTNVDQLVSPIRQTATLSSFFPSPARFLPQLPASPASLFFSPSTRSSNHERNTSGVCTFNQIENENQIIEQIDNYFTGRQQYLQHNIDVSMNMSRWILEHLIFYSVETLRRQAQIQGDSSRTYLMPISAIQMIYTMKNQQGIGVLWKGCFSSLILTTTETMSNNLIDEIAPFNHPSLREKHLMLKAISTFLLIPLYSVHFLRSVQSDLTIANHWSPLTIFIEPFQRVLGIKTGFYARALPLWYLITLSIPYFVCRHVLEYFLCRSFREYREKYFQTETISSRTKEICFETVDDIECQLIDTIPTLSSKSFLRIETNLFAAFFSSLILYPYETVMNRLFVQGTRTIVDNLDKTGVGCTPVNTRYLGVFDCCRTIIECEGRWGQGFFKGVGFSILKFGLIYAGAHCLKFLIERSAILYTQNTSELSKFHRYVLSNQDQQTDVDTDRLERS